MSSGSSAPAAAEAEGGVGFSSVDTPDRCCGGKGGGKGGGSGDSVRSAATAGGALGRGRFGGGAASFE